MTVAFRVGQKVVCVDAKGGIDPKPVEGTIYTIRQTLASPILGIPSVRLQELICPTETFTGQEGFFYALRFRPIVERKTDISIFTKMLTPQGVDA
jgi:hypothetical protein